MKIIPVADYLSFYMRKSGKSNKEISDAVGLQSSNLISMIKKGKSKIPLARVAQLADYLEIPKQDFFLRCLAEYDPALFRAIYHCLPGAMLPAEEVEALKRGRRILDEAEKRQQERRRRKLQRARAKVESTGGDGVTERSE